jgi:hypothetical protein
MLSNSDGYREAGELTRLLQKQYEAVRAELRTVAENTAREEVERIAAENERELQRLIGDAVASHRGRGIQFQTTHAMWLVAVVLVVWLASPYVGKAVSALGFGRSSADTEVKGTNGVTEEPGNLPQIERGPLHQVAAMRYDSLFARRDSAIHRLIVDAGPATLDSTVVQALARWTADAGEATDDDRDIVHAAAFQIALRKLAGGEFDSPVNGKVNRADCARDEYCRTLVARWRGDRSTGMRLLPPIPDRRDPGANELISVEKLVIYSQLSP